MLTISNIVLNTKPGYIYDIYLNLNVDFTYPSSTSFITSYDQTFNTVNKGIFCNLSRKNIQNPINSTINTPQSSVTYMSYSLSGS